MFSALIISVEYSKPDLFVLENWLLAIPRNKVALFSYEH